MDFNASALAITLIELLVALAIIGILWGLALAATQQIRSVADRIACADRLRNIGLALQQHQGVKGRLPPGVVANRPGASHPRAGWQSWLLPYIEQDALWQQILDSYQTHPYPLGAQAHPGLSAVISVFTCPSDGRTHTAQVSRNLRLVATTSFVGVLGTDYRRTDGVLFIDSGVGLQDITDGSSSTIAVGERPPSSDLWYGWWYAGLGQANTGSCDMLLGVRERNHGGSDLRHCGPGPFHFKQGTIEEMCDVFHFWSLHVGGGHFLFCDGSVRFLSYFDCARSCCSQRLVGYPDWVAG